jgi:DNA polymerase-3 subunit gamma/tau
LRDASSKKILLEVALLKAIEARNAMSLDTVLRKLEALRGSGESAASVGKPAAPVTASARPAADTGAPSPAPVRHSPAAAISAASAEPEVQALAETPPAAGQDQFWAQLLEAVGRASPFSRSYLLEAHLVSLTKGVLTIGFPSEFADHIALVDNPRNQALLQNKLSELGHPGLQVKFIKADPPEGRRPAPAAESQPAAPSPAAAPVKPPATAAKPAPAQPPAKAKPAAPASINKEEFKNDPLIRHALDLFKGQVVEARG